MSLFDDLLENETIASMRARVVAYAKSAGLAITDWIEGDPAEQMLQTVALASFQLAQQITAAVRGFASLDTATDPGDDDPFDPDNVNRPPSKGFLSNKGENEFGTPRQGQTFAEVSVDFTNAGPGAETFFPDQLTFTWTLSGPPSPAPTYRNASAPSIYTNPDGSVTVPAATTISLPIQAEVAGKSSSAPAGAITLTTTLINNCSATNPAPVLGRDRENADDYRARCKEAPARVSLAGPYDAYDYFAKTNLDGTPLLNANGDVVGITRTQQTQESAVATVNVWFATSSGAPIADDVDAANNNIQIQSFAVPGARTYTGQAATETSIHVAGTGKIKARPGVSRGAVIDAILRALAKLFAQYPIGGRDQDGSGNGTFYAADIHGVAATAFPGLYDVVLSSPADTALVVGHVGTLNSLVIDWTIAVVP